MPCPENRRPLASRDTGWARALSRRLAGTALTPNQISIAGMGFAAVAGAAFAGTGYTSGWGRAGLLILAALGCQLRLVCNLMDGLVAIEGGRQAKDGPFWNEFPDRISDILILIGVGYGVGLPQLGWAAASMAIFTAYTREMGRSIGMPADFSGPMAKPQRMAVLTVAAVVSIFEALWAGQGGLLRVALWAVCLGAGLTVLRRSRHIIAALKRRP
jgi:phosphatidylglycerophosphate synthase